MAAPEGHDDGAHHNLAASRRQKFVVLAVDRTQGKILWQRTVRERLQGQPIESLPDEVDWPAVEDGVKSLLAALAADPVES